MINMLTLLVLIFIIDIFVFNILNKLYATRIIICLKIVII